MRIAGVIPARYKSSRFPGKPLVNISGIPMVIRVADKVQEVLGKQNTYIATDDARIAEVCREFGYQAVMTSEHCKTGTDRLAEFSRKVQADIYVNVQGDEPIIDPADILKVIEVKKLHPGKVVNAMCNLLPIEDPANLNIPKVAVSGTGRLLYISRLPIPGIKDLATGRPVYKKQVCIYAFNRHELSLYESYSNKADCERYEDIEILRFLDAGVEVMMVETSGKSVAVDVPDDVLLVEKFLS